MVKGVDFSKTSEETGTNGLYYTNVNTEDNKTTYYFRGDVNNNYVKLPGKSTKINSTCTHNDYIIATDITEEECLVNVCDLTRVGGDYEYGLSEEECNQHFNANINYCEYNGEEAMYVLDLSTFDFSRRPTKSQCEHTNVCDVGTVLSDMYGINYRYVVGVTPEICSQFNGEWKSDKAIYNEDKYKDYNPYLDEKPIYKVTYEEKNETYWRIIRINEDGSIRLIYQGDTIEANIPSDSTIGYSIFQSNSGVGKTDNAYVGYMYGTANSDNYKDTHANIYDSEVKAVVDNWYEQNLKTNYSGYLADSGFCNDRSVVSREMLLVDNNTALGYDHHTTYYGPAYRFENDYAATSQPQFLCPQTNDLFTTNTSNKGNKALDYPIGLITADEVVYAGYDGNGGSSYLSIGGTFWTMSPKNTREMKTNSRSDYSVDSTLLVRPVINLRSDIEITGGNGTTTTPYVIKTN